MTSLLSPYPGVLKFVPREFCVARDQLQPGSFYVSEMSLVTSLGVHDGPQVEHVMVDGAALEVVDKFCYLGDMISAGGGTEESVIARTRS